jgi:hypothetical protein
MAQAVLPAGDGGGNSAGPGVGDPDLDPKTAARLRGQAGAEIDAETNAAIAPYQADIGTYTSRSASAVATFADMFKGILGAAGESASREEDFYKSSLGMEKDIFGAATDQLNQFRQGQAVEAQTLAQRLGGPVPISEFTYGVDVAQKQARNDFASSMLHSLGAASANVAEAEAFAGRVLPLVQKEETSKTVRYFNDLIAEAQKNIDSIKSGAAAKKTARYDELRAAELSYRLDKLKADRDWAIARQSARQQQQQINQQNRQAETQRDIAMGRVKLYDYKDKSGKRHVAYAPTLEAQSLALDKAKASAAAAEAGGQAVDPVTGQRYGPTTTQQQVTLQGKQYAAQQAKTDQANATNLLDAAVSAGGSGKIITISQKVPVDATQAGQSGVYKTTVNGKTVYYRYQNVKMTVPGMGLRDPRDVYKFLVSRNIPPATAALMTGKRFGLGAGWKPGAGFTHTQLMNMAQSGPGGEKRLRSLAAKLGYSVHPKTDTVEDYASYILKHQNKPSYYVPPKGALEKPPPQYITVKGKGPLGVTAQAPNPAYAAWKKRHPNYKPPSSSAKKK